MYHARRHSHGVHHTGGTTGFVLAQENAGVLPSLFVTVVAIVVTTVWAEIEGWGEIEKNSGDK